MDQSTDFLRLLCSRPALPLGGRVESAIEWLNLVSTYDPLNAEEPPDNYGKKEIRTAIRLYHQLPDTMSIKLDLHRVYLMLGKEYQDVFDLYACGFTCEEIARYWSGLFAGKRHRPQRQVGDRVVVRLVERVRWLMGLRQELVPLGKDLKC